MFNATESFPSKHRLTSFHQLPPIDLFDTSFPSIGTLLLTVECLGPEDSLSVDGPCWDHASRLTQPERGVYRPVADLSPMRRYQQDIRRSMSFNSWKGDQVDCPAVCDELPQITHRSSDEANNAEEDIINTKVQGNEALTVDLKKKSSKEDSKFAEENQYKKEQFETAPGIASELRCMAKKPSKKLLDQLLLQKESSEGSNGSYLLASGTDMSRETVEKRHSSWLSLDNETVDSAQQYNQELWSHWDTDLETNSIVSEESRGVHRRTWSTEPLDSFVDGTETKTLRLRSIGSNRQYLTHKPPPQKCKEDSTTS